MSTPKASKKKPAPAKPSPPGDAAAALKAVRAEIDSLSDSEIIPINTNVPRAVSIVIGAAPHLKALRPRFVEELPKHPLHFLDNIDKYAMAAWYAHLASLPPLPPEDTARELMEQGGKLRASLLVAAEALAHRGLLDADRIAEIRAGAGYVDSASDLVALSAIFSEQWGDIEKKTAVEWEEIERAAHLGPAILMALGERETPPMAVEEASALRQRAFSLLVKAYDQCRRGAAYLLWGTEDLNDVAPSLYTTRGRARKAPAEGSDSSPEAGSGG